jgi:autotransporter adhesin
LQGGQAALGGRLDNLMSQTNIDRRDARQGIAAAVAMTAAPMPSAPGRTSYVLNGATFRGQYAIGGSIMHRFDGDRPFALTAGFSYGGNGNSAARVGVAGEF